jgi:hypothetical protein
MFLLNCLANIFKEIVLIVKFDYFIFLKTRRGQLQKSIGAKFLFFVKNLLQLNDDFPPTDRWECTAAVKKKC